MQPEDIDKLFRAGLEGHRSPAPRDLWERLEDEHLHPPKKRRRAAAWWPYAAAAALALLVLAGGAGLWRGVRRPDAGVGPVARTAVEPNAARRGQPALADRQATAARHAEPMAAPTPLAQAAAGTLATASETVAPRRTAATPGAATRAAATPASAEKLFRHRATAALALASGQPASGAERASAAADRPAGPDAPAASQVVARSTAPDAAPVLAANSSPTSPTPAGGGVIEVEVRAGAAPAASGPVVAVAAGPAAESPRRGRLLGGLWRQAGHLVRGERLNLAEATGLPETLTVQARVGGRTLSKSIEL